MNSIIEQAQAYMLAKILSDEQKIEWITRMLAEKSEVVRFLEEIVPNP